MKCILVYQEPELGQAWRKHFSSAQDVEIVRGDICAIECDAIVSPTAPWLISAPTNCG